jgi:amidase
VPASFTGLYGLRPSFGRIATEGATPMAPSYDTIGFLARDAELFRKIGHVLLEGEPIEAKVERLLLAEDLFGHAEASADQALWNILARLGPALPVPDTGTSSAKRSTIGAMPFVIQGFEMQSTLLPFIQSHDVDLRPGIKERFAAAAEITGRAEAARRLRARSSDVRTCICGPER